MMHAQSVQQGTTLEHGQGGTAHLPYMDVEEEDTGCRSPQTEGPRRIKGLREWRHNLRYFARGRRVDLKQAQAYASAGDLVYVMPQLEGGGCGFSVRACLLCRAHSLTHICS